ncbi:MAG: protein kinase [Deltaproteobacteria bacterium]|nr:protein kinase [Deltaproteobacteria bacterium]
MLDEALASRYDLSDQVNEDKIGRHTSGKRQSDDRDIVLTVVDPQLKVSQSDVAAVAEASRNLADLMLSSVLHCVEVGRTEGGNLYLISERADFDTLKARIRAENGLTTEDALAVAYRVAAVLRSASGTGIHHQDLSSANIYADFSGETPNIQVARYGFSHLMQPYAPTRKNEPFYGTAEYMAPEVCSGRPSDDAADLYGLGILMYEMIAGKPPFVSSSPSTTIKRQVYEKPLPLHLVKPGTHNLEVYEKLVTKLLAKDPKARPADATEVMEAIAALKAEAFPDVNLDLAPERDAPIEVVSLFEDGGGEEAEEEAAASAPPSDSRETMVFTGLASQVAGATASEPDDKAETGTEPETEEPAVEPSSQPTEAFDPSMVKQALREMGSADEGDEEEKPTEEPEVEKPAEVALPDSSDDEGTKAEDWFVEGGEQLPESAFPADEQTRKESRMFWVIVGAVAILVGVGAAIYFDGGRPKPPQPPKPIIVTPAPTPPNPAPTPRPVPVASPDIARTDAAAPEPGSAVAETPDPGPPTPTPEEIKAEKLARMLAQGQTALNKGNIDEAGRLADAILAEQAGHEGARELKADVNAKLDELKKEKEKKAAEKQAAKKKKRKKRRKRVAKPKAAPENKPEVKAKPAPQPTVEETQQKLRHLIRTGRDAYKKGDYKTAIRNYQKALNIDKNNALVRKLLDQAKAKSSQ